MPISVLQRLCFCRLPFLLSHFVLTNSGSAEQPASSVHRSVRLPDLTLQAAACDVTLVSLHQQGHACAYSKVWLKRHLMSFCQTSSCSVHLGSLHLGSVHLLPTLPVVLHSLLVTIPGIVLLEALLWSKRVYSV